MFSLTCNTCFFFVVQKRIIFEWSEAISIDVIRLLRARSFSERWIFSAATGTPRGNRNESKGNTRRTRWWREALSREIASTQNICIFGALSIVSRHGFHGVSNNSRMACGHEIFMNERGVPTVSPPKSLKYLSNIHLCVIKTFHSTLL